MKYYMGDGTNPAPGDDDPLDLDPDYPDEEDDDDSSEDDEEDGEE